MTGRVAVGAQTVQDGAIKASHLGHGGVNVQRVEVAAQAVESGLVAEGEGMGWRQRREEKEVSAWGTR